jgi:XTP/dITP diphosphohydrolase
MDQKTKYRALGKQEGLSMKILYATSNDYKLLAANTALKDLDIVLEKLSDSALDVPEIQADTQAEVALDKAMKYYELCKRPLIVMDFGFFIEGLKGFPGVYTKHAIETIGVDGLKELTRSLENRTAFTQRTIVYIDEAEYKVFSSRCPGTILMGERGKNGRDYDFIFQVDATGKTLAEMTEEEKAVESGEAWRELGAWLVSR